jgi:hypothetical protein
VENRVVEVLVMGAVLSVVGRRAEDQVVEAKGVRAAKAKTAVKAAKCTMDSPHL